jgi:hypothetical protein
MYAEAESGRVRWMRALIDPDIASTQFNSRAI